MKKFLALFTVIIITVGISRQAFTQTSGNSEDLKKSAEDFVTTWFKNWENKNWDAVTNAITENTTYSDVQVTQPLSSVIEYMLRSGSMPEMKITVQSVTAQILGSANALVNARYLQETSTNANPKMTEQLDIFLLDLDSNSWKIRNYYSTETFQVNFSPGIEKKWQYGKADLQQRFSNSVSSRTNLLIYILEDNEKRGISAGQVGINLGERYAKLRNQSLGFNDMVYVYTSFLQGISTYLELTERDENHAKFRYDPSLQLLATSDIDAVKLLDYWNNYFLTHASFFGTKASVVQDGNYYILSIEALKDWLPAKVTQQVNVALAAGDSAKAEILRAGFLASQGKLQDASKIYLRIMKTHPNNKEAVQGWLMANMERSPSGEEKAIKQLESLGKQYPENTGIIFYKMFLEAEYGHNEEALKDVSMLIKLQPDSAVNYIGKGQILHEMGKYKEAFKAFDKATKLDSGRFDVWGMKAGSLAKLGKYEEALASCNKGIELAPSNAIAIYNRGCIYSLKGDKAHALADLKSSVEIDPSLKQHAKSDEDFKKLWQDEEFIALTNN